MQTVTVEISPEGQVTVTTKGFHGAKCLTETQALETALGSVQSSSKTPEFFQGAACVLPKKAEAGQ